MLDAILEATFTNVPIRADLSHDAMRLSGDLVAHAKEMVARQLPLLVVSDRRVKQWNCGLDARPVLIDLPLIQRLHTIPELSLDGACVLRLIDEHLAHLGSC